MVLTVTAARCADFQVKAPGRVAGPLPEVSHDQHAHLDALLCGIFMLVNLMAGKNHVGVMLNSGGCVHALKELVDKDFDRFEEEFDAELCDKMKERTEKRSSREPGATMPSGSWEGRAARRSGGASTSSWENST